MRLLLPLLPHWLRPQPLPPLPLVLPLLQILLGLVGLGAHQAVAAHVDGEVVERVQVKKVKVLQKVQNAPLPYERQFNRS